MSYRFFSFIRFLLLLLALVLASFLAFGDMFDDTTLEPQRIFVLDSNMTMNTEDIRSGGQYISRFQAAKLLIHQLVIADPQLSYGVILFNAQADYIIPPTFDT